MTDNQKEGTKMQRLYLVQPVKDQPEWPEPETPVDTRDCIIAALLFAVCAILLLAGVIFGLLHVVGVI